MSKRYQSERGSSKGHGLGELCNEIAYLSPGLGSQSTQTIENKPHIACTLLQRREMTKVKLFIRLL